MIDRITMEKGRSRLKIDTNQIPLDGLTLKEKISPAELDLETEMIKLRDPIIVNADISKITNAVTVNLNLKALMYANCSRCMSEFDFDFKENMRLNYQVGKSNPVIDLGPDIREEIILAYPIKPLCKADCRGLCAKCGKNLNEGGCSCATT